MSLKGTFASYYTSSLLKLFNSEKKSGEFIVRKGKDETTVYMAEGNVVYATSTQKELRLGAFLISQRSSLLSSMRCVSKFPKPEKVRSERFF